MVKDADYKKRSVIGPITIFIVFLTICLMIPLVKVMTMWGINSAYEGLGREAVCLHLFVKSHQRSLS